MVVNRAIKPRCPCYRLPLAAIPLVSFVERFLGIGGWLNCCVMRQLVVKKYLWFIRERENVIDSKIFGVVAEGD